MEDAPFPLLRLPKEIICSAIQLAIPKRLVDVRTDIAATGDQYDKICAIQNLRLVCHLFNTIVEGQLHPAFRLFRVKLLVCGDGPYHASRKVIEHKMERLDLLNDRLRLEDGDILPPPQWLGKKSETISIRNLVIHYSSFHLGRPNRGPAPPFRTDIPSSVFPELKDIIVSFRFWEGAPAISWPEPETKLGLVPNSGRAKPVTEIDGIGNIEPYGMTENWPAKAIFFRIKPLPNCLIPVTSLVKDHDFLSIRGYSAAGGHWAGFRYSTDTGTLYFTPLECRDVVTAFGVCNGYRDWLGGAESRAAGFVARLWIDPGRDLVERYDWVVVRPSVEGDPPMIDEIAKTWAFVRAKMFSLIENWGKDRYANRTKRDV
ncbi:hypothetical protein BGZ63DRAFT_149437 [Mariannaea sp. PMI_226]|nr:hypothetical protein BGZ63DRAFT_149437 [Mariannaea sp. PMI_226]